MFFAIHIWVLSNQHWIRTPRSKGLKAWLKKQWIHWRSRSHDGWHKQELLPMLPMVEAPCAHDVARLTLGLPVLESDEPFSHLVKSKVDNGMAKSKVDNDMANSLFFEWFTRLRFEKILVRYSMTPTDLRCSNPKCSLPPKLSLCRMKQPTCSMH